MCTHIHIYKDRRVADEGIGLRLTRGPKIKYFWIDTYIYIYVHAYTYTKTCE